MEEVMSSSLQGFVMKRIWIHGGHKMQNESLGKSFYSLSFNFQKVSNFNQSHNNQTINQNNLFVYNIPKFRILWCYNVQDGDIDICKVHTDLNVADPLTKPLPRAKHDQHQNSMGVRFITM